MTEVNTHLIGPRYYLPLYPEGFRWSDPRRVPLSLKPGDWVIVVTDEGALRRGRRRWHPGARGIVVRKHKHHDRGWLVEVHGNGLHTVLLFSDEMLPAPDLPQEGAA